MNGFYAQLIRGLVVLLAVASVLGAVWALLKPVLVPLSVVAVVAALVYMVLRQR